MVRPAIHTIRHGWLIACALLTFAACGQALAQTTITGSVTAPTGSTLEGTRVVAFDPATGKTFQGTIDASGKFTITVEPGTFNVSVVGRGFAPQTFQNVAVKEGEAITQNVTLAASQPICIPKAAAPPALTDDFNSAAFAKAAEFSVSGGAAIVEGFENVANFRGDQTVGGKVRMLWSDQGLHIAADIMFAKPNTNFGTDQELFKGNSLELILQNDPLNLTRTDPDPMHNFRVVVALTEQPRLRLGQNLEQQAMVNGQAANISQLVSVQNRSDSKGNLVRVDIPWAVLMTGGNSPQAITPPQVDTEWAMDIRINTTTPEATQGSAARQFQLAASGFGGTDPRGLIRVKFCPAAQ